MLAEAAEAQNLFPNSERETSQSGFPDQNYSARLPEFSWRMLWESRKPAGDWVMTTEPVAPASSHLPCPGVAECCLQTVSPANLGADCSTEDAWDGRGAESSQASWPQRWNHSHHSYPFGLVGVQESSSRVDPAFHKSKSCGCFWWRGIQVEWVMSPQNWCSLTCM